MNKEDYVSLEVAKLLKEKEFDYATLYYYEKNGKLGMMNLDAQSQMRKHGYMNDIYPRPTLYEAAKWLREKHLLYIDVEAYYTYYEVDENDYRDQERSWEYSIWEDTTYDVYEKAESKGCYDTYEEALNAGILEALKLI